MAPAGEPIVSVAQAMAAEQGMNPPQTPQEDPCTARVVSYATPCSKEPDPCNIKSGWPGDNYCLPAPAADKGVQIHFGPTNYMDKAQTDRYVINPGQEFNNSVLAKIPLTEAKAYDHIEIHMRPGSHHWISMSGPAGAQEGFYPDTGCGTGQQFGGGGFGGGQNLIYDNPPHGMPAPENVGLGRQIAPGASCIGLHAYNFEDKPHLREIWVNLYYMDASKITQQAGGIGKVGELEINLAPGRNQTYTYTMSAAGMGRIIQLFGHRHQWTPRFAAWLGSELIYDSHSWQESATFDYDSLTKNPPMDGMHDGAKSGVVPFNSGDVLKFSCFVENKSKHALTFQNELEGGEMCNMWGSTVGASFR